MRLQIMVQKRWGRLGLNLFSLLSLLFFLAINLPMFAEHNDMAELNIALTTTPLSATVSGRVTNSDGGSESGIDVNLINESGAIVATTVTDIDGKYLFEIPPEDVDANYSLEFVVAPTYGQETTFVSGVAHPSMLPTEAISGITIEFLVVSGSALNFDVVIERNNHVDLPATVRGIVTESGIEKEGIEVTLLDENGSIYSVATTDSSGNYLFDIPVSGVDQNYTLCYLIPALDLDGHWIPAYFTEGVRDVTVDENMLSKATSRLFELSSGSEFVNDVAYESGWYDPDEYYYYYPAPNPVPTAVTLSNINTVTAYNITLISLMIMLPLTSIVTKRQPFFLDAKRARIGIFQNGQNSL